MNVHSFYNEGDVKVKQITYIDDYCSWRESFQFYNEVKVRFSETDMFGHLNNTIPFTYFEQARIEYFNHQGLMKEWLKDSSDCIPVVGDLQCHYLKQVFFEETLKIYVKTNSIGTSSMDLHYMAVNTQNEICFVGRGSIIQMSKLTVRCALE